MQRWISRRPLLCAVALALALAACATVPTAPDPLPQRDLAAAQLADGIRLTHEGWPPAQWWTRYGDDQLNRLVQQALTGSPTLQVAQTRITSAHAALMAEQVELGARIGADAQTNRHRYSANGLFPPPIGGGTFNQTTAQLQGRLDFDWWGKRRSLIAAAVGEVNARQAEQSMAEQALAAQVADRYFSWQAGAARIGNLQRIISLQQQLLQDRRRRIAHGLAAADEQRHAQADLAASQRELAGLAGQRDRDREALRALLGADGQELADLVARPLSTAAPALPQHLGMELLARRADLQAARWRVEASMSRIEAAQAAFYPDINLSGSIGLDVLSLGKLMSAPSRTWSIGPALSLPLFDSGRLQARLDVVRRQRNEQIADYNQAVVSVLREVAQEAVALTALAQQRRDQAQVSQAGDALLKLAQTRLRHGLAARGDVLTAELATLRERDIDLLLQGRQLASDVALTRALGGGYRAATGNGESAMVATPDAAPKPPLAEPDPQK